VGGKMSAEKEERPVGAGRSQCASGQAGVKTIFNSPTLYPEMAVQVNREKK
jgi:hypothetical protein